MKLGFSVFLHNPLYEKAKEQIEYYANNGFSGIFTSLNLPEDDPTMLMANLSTLGHYAKAHHLELTVDISKTAYTRLNLDVTDPSSLIKLGVTRLRIDDGITIKDIATLSNQLPIALNASTISVEDIENLHRHGATFQNLEAWHNYYPRKATGLETTWFDEKNQWLKNVGFSVMAFTPGNTALRGPVFATLPTLEKHRYMNPFAAALELMTLHVDSIYLGDPGVTDGTLRQFAAFQNDQCVLFRAHFKKNAPRYLNQVFHQRPDIARDSVRLMEGRQLATGNIDVDHTTARNTGAITLDNHLAGRYMGELELVKHLLPPDQTVNVIGQVIDEDFPLLQLLAPKQRIMLEKVSD